MKTDRLPNVSSVSCALGSYEARLLVYSDEPHVRRARRVLKAWKGRLFKGAVFRIWSRDATARVATWGEVAGLFGIEPTMREVLAPVPAVALAPVVVAPLAQVASTAKARPGRVPVQKEILHRGRRFVVTYWVKETDDMRKAA